MSLIDAVLSALVGELEDGLQAASARPEPWIAFGPPGEAAGGGLRAMVLSVDGDGALGRFDAGRHEAAAVPVEGAPPLAVDVRIAFVADVRRKDYLAGLGLISEVVALMQARPVFEAEVPAGRAGRRVRLPAELVALDLAERGRAALLLGAAGRAFVVYRLRRLPFDGGAFGAVAARVGGGEARR